MSVPDFWTTEILEEIEEEMMSLFDAEAMRLHADRATADLRLRLVTATAKTILKLLTRSTLLPTETAPAILSWDVLPPRIVPTMSFKPGEERVLPSALEV